MYEGTLASLIHHPNHVGEIAEASGIGDVTNPVCGDRMQLFILVKERVITEAKFKVYGCAPTIATGSVAAELVRGKSIDEAMKITRDEIVEAVGGLPNRKLHCATLAVDAIWSAVENWRRMKSGGTLG